MITSACRWRNWDTEKLSNLLDFTQQVSSGIKGQKHTVWVGNTILNCPCHWTFCSSSTTTDLLLPTSCLFPTCTSKQTSCHKNLELASEPNVTVIPCLAFKMKGMLPSHFLSSFIEKHLGKYFMLLGMALATLETQAISIITQMCSPFDILHYSAAFFLVLARRWDTWANTILPSGPEHPMYRHCLLPRWLDDLNLNPRFTGDDKFKLTWKVCFRKSKFSEVHS